MSKLENRIDKLEQKNISVDDWTHAPRIPESIMQAIEASPDLATIDPELWASLTDWQLSKVGYDDKSK